MVTAAPPSGAGETHPPQMTSSICPDCRGQVSGVGHRYHCQNCDCLFSEHPADQGVAPIPSHSWNRHRPRR
ncbi:hypothetical protein Strvi_0056 (plasmid) [Streptomyces violaceusniger Tu 4113]|uniref:Uncharacterized protein n=1 Tax=Streptomyces violaceusniger (strain Tu 4113) TaxID=653045 RepID=G2PHN1_STRV4|nr:hypothetical protein Strvi_0056 [Streptomyces violaceusniger Tu 4113]